MIYLSHFLDAAICILIKLHYVQHSLVLLSCPIPPMLIARIEFNKFLPINAAIFKAELLGKLSDEPVCGLLVRCVEFFHILLRQLVHEADQLYVDLRSVLSRNLCPPVPYRILAVHDWTLFSSHNHNQQSGQSVSSPAVPTCWLP